MVDMSLRPKFRNEVLAKTVKNAAKRFVILQYLSPLASEDVGKCFVAATEELTLQIRYPSKMLCFLDICFWRSRERSF